MIKSFNILVLGSFIVGEALDISLESIAQLIDECNPSKKALKINIIESEAEIQALNHKIKSFRIHGFCNVTEVKEHARIETIYSNADVILLPQPNCKMSILKEALSMRIIPICRDFENASEYIDESSSVIITGKTREIIRNAFAEALQILIEDEEAVEMLKHGAIRKYQNAFCWGDTKKLKRQSSAA